MNDSDQDDVVFDVDFVSCSRCGRELHPGFADFLGDGDRVCRECLSDLGAVDYAGDDPDAAVANMRSLPDTEKFIYLQTKHYMRPCAQCGNWYEDGTGIKSVFGSRLCRSCVRAVGIGAFFFRRGSL